MGKFICLQAGHQNRTTGSTGAPGEVEANIRIRDRLSQLLIERGFMVQLVGADPTPEEINKDFDLFLALHCDADYPNDNGGGFADYPEPSTDGATAESQRICKIINDYYFPEVKINYVNRSNANTRYYYMWKRLSAKTPCVIIEMGQIQDPHDKVLLANTELIAGALKVAICKAFGVDPNPPAPQPEPPQTPPSQPGSVPEPEPTLPTTDENAELLNKLHEVIHSRWTWVGKTNGWKLRLSQLKELLP